MRQSVLLRLACALSLLLLTGAILPAAAQTASLVRDIEASDNTSSPGGVASQLILARDKIFLAGDESGSGSEPWVSDGTWNGTQLLADLCPGPCTSQPVMLGSVGGTAIFLAEPDSQRLLWRSDGTRVGTYALTGPEAGLDIYWNTIESVGISSIFNGAFYFTGCTELPNHCGLWRTDGTREGTLLLHDGLKATDMTPAASRLFFLSAGSELWVTNGTTAGTKLVKQLPLQSNARLTAVGDRLFFGATSGEGQEVWTSNGTEAGTRPLTQLPTFYAFGSSFDSLLFKVSDPYVYFIADDVVHGEELWRSDGTPAGTRRITDFGYNEPFDHHRAPRVDEAGGRIIFVASDGLTETQLWMTDGSPESTAPLQCQGQCPVEIDTDLLKVGARIVFVASVHFSGNNELWASDGTARGTRPILGRCPSCSLYLKVVDARPREVLLTAHDLEQGGSSFWRTDGTEAGTKRVAKHSDSLDFTYSTLLWTGGKVWFPAFSPYGMGLWETTSEGGTRLVAAPWAGGASSNPAGLVEYQERLFFTACTGGHDRKVWQSAGTFESTVRVSNADDTDSSCERDPYLTPAGNFLFFQSYTALYESDLWRTDGTPEGTIQLTQGGDLDLASLAELGGLLFFPRYIPFQAAIWKSDGTPQGTTEAIRLPGGPYLFRRLGRAGSELYFVASLQGIGFSIWRSDGTQGGTREILDFPEGSGYPGDPQFTRLGSRVFFIAGRRGEGGRLWTTDGTPDGTAPLLDTLGGPAGYNVRELTVFQGALYYFADTPNGLVPALWRSNGTPGGTYMLRTFARPRFSPEPTFVTVFAGRLFFAADDGEHGQELWSSDGTAAGTSLVRDIFPGPHGSQPAWLREAGGRLWFSAGDGVHGFELWQSDGTAAGTRMVQDIAPMGGSSRPERLTVAGGRLYFSAHDGISGRELWSLPLTAPAGCQPSPTRLCLNSGRFQVEATWRDFQRNTGIGRAVGLTGDTGYFWFFDESNVEVILKILDGRPLNNHFWVFYGALSNVEYTLTVTDTQTGLTRQYFNPRNQLTSSGDTRGFGPLGANSRSAPAVAAPSPLPLVSERTDPATAAGPCQTSATRLCLNGGRFAVEASWKDFKGNTGNGQAVSLTGDTGYFWFFDSTNVEVVLKVLDGTPVNGKHWVFYGALSNVEYTLTVTDTQTGKVKTYKNPSGRFASVADTAAF